MHAGDTSTERTNRYPQQLLLQRKGLRHRELLWLSRSHKQDTRQAYEYCTSHLPPLKIPMSSRGGGESSEPPNKPDLVSCSSDSKPECVRKQVRFRVTLGIHLRSLMARNEGRVTKSLVRSVGYRSTLGCWRGDILFKSLLLSAVCGRQVLNSFIHSLTHSFIHPLITFVHSFNKCLWTTYYEPGRVLRVLQTFSCLAQNP